MDDFEVNPDTGICYGVAQESPPTGVAMKWLPMRSLRTSRNCDLLDGSGVIGNMDRITITPVKWWRRCGTSVLSTLWTRASPRTGNRNSIRKGSARHWKRFLRWSGLRRVR